MPKMKTKRAAAKRFSMTATGKIKIKKSSLRHILTKKSRNLKREKRKIGFVHASDMRRTLKTLPYGA